MGNRPHGVAISNGSVLVSLRQSGAGTSGRHADGADEPARRLDRHRRRLRLGLVFDPADDQRRPGRLQAGQRARRAPSSCPTSPSPSRRLPTAARRTPSGSATNIRYSNGRPVKASDFRSTFERDFELGLPVPYYDGIIGAARCENERPKRCDLQHGIVADDAAKTVTFHLTAADPEFLDKLALGFANVVPAGTPARDVGAHPLPGDRAVRDRDLPSQTPRQARTQPATSANGRRRHSRTATRTRSSVRDRRHSRRSR